MEDRRLREFEERMKILRRDLGPLGRKAEMLAELWEEAGRQALSDSSPPPETKARFKPTPKSKSFMEELEEA